MHIRYFRVHVAALLYTRYYRVPYLSIALPCAMSSQANRAAQGCAARSQDAASFAGEDMAKGSAKTGLQFEG